MEHWDGGMMGRALKTDFSISNIPLFHHSIIPI
jgi:hypothetical protein